MTLEISLEERSYTRLVSVKADPVKWGQEGWPDRMVLWGRGLHFWIEFKKEYTGRMRAMQKVRRKYLESIGDKYYLVDTFEQVLDIIAAWEMAYGPASARAA